ncbi:hypothetical protein SteCoe_32616 [Stentor coeruleus]|uniref:UBC core domain-containing protein n=1 Tax=Stentor coeruleus TaxID=5963 RepID=A0A1R2AYQ2_9CILI|nr:hypothetical protein SteCoe_32616 [Stentor coeruleus]
MEESSIPDQSKQLKTLLSTDLKHQEMNYLKTTIKNHEVNKDAYTIDEVIANAIKENQLLISSNIEPKTEEKKIFNPSTENPGFKNESQSVESPLDITDKKEKESQENIVGSFPLYAVNPHFEEGKNVPSDLKTLEKSFNITQDKLETPENPNSDCQNENLLQPPQALFREPSSNDPEAPDSEHNYFKELGTYRLQMNDWSHHIIDYCYDNQPLNQEGLSRINKEIKAMNRALPCEPSGAVFVNIDSSNLSRIKALISGTEDTPYEHGLYLFDIKLDGNYPNTPPKMTIKTNGNYIFRFNPNLYDSGFVCLSIINTWNGSPEEMWNPSYSTLLQVFLSIQALVMDNDVIQKEPGYEHMATNCCENKDYVGIVKYGNMKYAMIDMMRNPPDDFKDIIKKHFALKKEKIIESAQKWVKESEDMGQAFDDYILACHNPMTIRLLKEKKPRNAFQECYDQLLEELSKLPSL